MRTEDEIKKILSRCSTNYIAEKQGLLDSYLQYKIVSAIRETLMWVLGTAETSKLKGACAKEVIYDYLIKTAQSTKSPVLYLYQSDIAVACGYSLPTVSTVLDQLRSENIITRNRKGEITLHDALIHQESQNEVRHS